MLILFAMFHDSLFHCMHDSLLKFVQVQKFFRLKLFGCTKLLDSQLLAEAERQISDNTKQEKEFLPIDQKESDAVGSSEPTVLNEKHLPEWALPLEPVKKLPTNVGTRIRKCIYDALERNPPEWAKKVLEHSISKEVYKGNASGPTKVMMDSVRSLVF